MRYAPEGAGVLAISGIRGCAAYIGGFSMPKSVNMGQFSMPKSVNMGQFSKILAFHNLFFKIDAYFCRNKICIGGSVSDFWAAHPRQSLSKYPPGALYSFFYKNQ